MFKVTREWLKAQASSKGSGFTRNQLAVVGIGWPPLKGWVENLVGSVITDEQKLKFEQCSGKTAFEAEKKRQAAYIAASRPYYTWPDSTSRIGWRGSWEKPSWWDAQINKKPATVPWE